MPIDRFCLLDKTTFGNEMLKGAVMIWLGGIGGRGDGVIEACLLLERPMYAGQLHQTNQARERHQMRSNSALTLKVMSRILAHRRWMKYSHVT